MTLNAVMDSLKEVFSRVATGPLRPAAWQLIRRNAQRDLQRLLQRDENLTTRSYRFHSIVDSNGGAVYNMRSRQSIQEAWLDTLTDPAVPQESLETSGTIRRRDGERAIVEVTAIRRSPTQLVTGRGSSDSEADEGSGGGGRREGSRASVRGGSVDPEALAGLSRALRSTSGARRANAPLDEP